MNKPSMFYGAKGNTFQNARFLRTHETNEEKLLWTRLSKNQLKGFRFKRQHPIQKFIADFYCHKAKLVIEIDGGYHDHPEQKMLDDNRTQILNELGLKVIRFSNLEISSNLDKVIQEIEKYLPATSSI